MKKKMVKKTVALFLAAGLLATLTACTASSSSSTESYKTVNGVTEGKASSSTSDKGSAGFEVSGNHVQMTNFAFDADESLFVQAEIVEEDLVFTRVLVHDGEDTIQHIADGHYPETFTPENAADSMNAIYQIVLGADDAPVTDDYITEDSGVLYTIMDLSDGQVALLLKEGSDEYVLAAVTTMDFGSQDIIDAAFAALAE